MITNNTTNTIISSQETICTSFLSQMWGLMFRKKQNLIMIFKEEKHLSLHNFLVFYPIDVIVIDKDMNVAEIKENFRPFTFWRSSKKGKYVIELGKDRLKGKVNPGNKILIKNLQ